MKSLHHTFQGLHFHVKPARPSDLFTPVGHFENFAWGVLLFVLIPALQHENIISGSHNGNEIYGSQNILVIFFRKV